MLYKDILLVDDDVDDTEIFLEAIKSLETKAVFRSNLNPVVALAELQTTNMLPDLIFLDYNMPLLNGLEFLHQMKKNKRLDQIKVILISTPPEEFMNPWLKKNNTVVPYFSKPSSYNELKTIISIFVK